MRSWGELPLASGRGHVFGAFDPPPVDAPVVTRVEGFVCPRCQGSWFDARAGGAPQTCPICGLAMRDVDVGGAL